MAGTVFAKGNDDQRCEQAGDTGRCDQQSAPGDNKKVHYGLSLHIVIMKQREGFVNG